MPLEVLSCEISCEGGANQPSYKALQNWPLVLHKTLVCSAETGPEETELKWSNQTREKLDLFYSMVRKFCFQDISRAFLEYFSIPRKTFPFYEIGQNFGNWNSQPFSTIFPGRGPIVTSESSWYGPHTKVDHTM